MSAKLDAFADWPVAGAPLAEVVARLAGPELLAEYSAARAVGPPFGLGPPTPVGWIDISGKLHSGDEAVCVLTRIKVALRACLATVVDAWDAGEILATGKRRDVLAAAVNISPPANLWTISGVDLGRSTIDDPAGGKIFDLRFHVGAPRPPMTPMEWVEINAKELIRTGNAPERPTDFAGVLRGRIIADARRGVVKKELSRRTIANYLGKLQLR